MVVASRVSTVLWSHINLFRRLMGGLPEIANPLTQSSANLGQLPGTENNQNNYQNYNEFGNTNTKHIHSLIRLAPGEKIMTSALLVTSIPSLPPNQKLAEVYGNRTHLSGYQPKTLDLKSRLPTSDRDTSKENLPYPSVRRGIYNNSQPQSQRHSRFIPAQPPKNLDREYCYS